MRILPVIEQALNDTGMPWDIEQGKKHHHIRINGKLVGILPMGSKAAETRTIKNCISQIKKAAKGIQWSSRQH